MEQVEIGWDLVFIARRPIRNATYQEIDAACARLLRRAHLLTIPAKSTLDNEQAVRRKQI